MQRVAGHDVDVGREVLFKRGLLRSFHRRLASDDCPDFRGLIMRKKVSKTEQRQPKDMRRTRPILRYNPVYKFCFHRIYDEIRACGYEMTVEDDIDARDAFKAASSGDR